MSGSVSAALGTIRRRSEHVFFNPETGRPIKDGKTAFHAACRRAKKDPEDEKDPGITGFRFHDLRHTVAVRALRGGADIMTVSRILGHSSILMTARYLQEDEESMRAAAEIVAGYLETEKSIVPASQETNVSPRPSILLIEAQIHYSIIPNCLMKSAGS